MEKMPKILKADEKQPTSFCIPLWLRDEQIKQNIPRIKDRVQKYEGLRTDPIAIACFGPSLNSTWPQISHFKYIMTCSGAHKFLIERGIIPTWHIDVDPRPHKAKLIGTPHKDVEYLILSCCHKDVFDLLEGHNVKLWHAYDNDEEVKRALLPFGEWALTGGCSAGLRCMTMARFLGFTEMHVFGMDGSEGETGKHADLHPSQAKGHSLTEYPEGSGRMWRTTPAFLEAARGTFHELDQMPDVTAKFYGDGLVQEMAKNYSPPVWPPGAKSKLAGLKPELISSELRELNARLHRENLAYGVGGGKHADNIRKVKEAIKAQSVLDYGCGKGYLAKALDFPVWEYDPAIPGKDESPRPADLVVCTDVLEHIEPDKLVLVLRDLQRVVRRVGYFIIHLGPAKKKYADGRNTHLIQKPAKWWAKWVGRFFAIAQIYEKGAELRLIVGPKGAKNAKPFQTVVTTQAVPARPSDGANGA